MLKKVKSCTFLLFFFTSFFSAFNLSAQDDTTVYLVKPENTSIKVKVDNEQAEVDVGSDYRLFWRFKGDDNYTYALIEYDDSDWEKIHPNLSSDVHRNKFNGIGWFRLHYRVPKSLVGQPLVFSVNHFGASEIFSDGVFVKHFGTVSADPKKEIGVNPQSVAFTLIVQDTLPHLLSVRYSNARYKEYGDRFHNWMSGIDVKITGFESYVLQQAKKDYVYIISIGLSIFFFALCLVHLLIFSYEPSRKFNLFYGLFVFMLFLVFLEPFILSKIESPIGQMWLSKIDSVFIPISMVSLMALLYNLFGRKLTWFFYSLIIMLILYVLDIFTINKYSDLFSITIVLSSYFSSLFISIKSIRTKQRGAKFVGWGVLNFTIFLILAAIFGFLLALPENKLTEDILLVLLLTCIVLSILSLPISMSAYLASDFAGANRTLKQQITQIELLSAQTLQQEQEKKSMLQNQNKMLEQQVSERTAEIVTKNNLLEDQKREITDSINYAKRIQQAILPNKKEVYDVLKNCFILSRPKDIVSGDFYFFHLQEGVNPGVKIFIAVADCTGHGVPGAFMSMVGSKELQIAVDKTNKTSEVLSLLNRGVKQTLRQNHLDGTKDGMDIALLGFPVMEEGKGTRVYYSAANRPLWIVRKGSREVEEIKATKNAIGGFTTDDQQFEEHEVQVNPGDTIYIFSDGYADQFGGEKEKKLTTRKFKEILLLINPMPMAEQEKYLDDFITGWRGSCEQVDDVLVIGIRIS
jgi:serine phosphatase RsbU (regulator of sigma subunit)